MRDFPTPAAFVDAVAPALREAAAIARGMEGRVANRPKAGEATPVKAALTVADTAAQEALLVPLLARFPQVAVEAEEDTPSASLFGSGGEALVVIDPIDGTLRFYLEGLGPYAVMVGLALGGAYEAALVALPREDLFYDAVRGAGARVSRGDAPAGEARAVADGRRVLISHDLPGPAVEILLAHGFQVSPACGGAIALAPLVPGVRAGLRWVRRGVLSIRGRIGALIAAEAGAVVQREDGAPLGRGVDTPASALVVAADPGDLPALHEALAAARSAE
jgi:fructose-1,6-bisphosphatase/inositol monophosphatase family enzyme